MKKFSSLKSILFCCTLSMIAVSAETKSLNQQLYEAVQFQEVASIPTLIARGAKPDYRENGRPLLGWAAQSGSAEVVEALLKAGANPNVADEGQVGHTPLMRAIETQQVENVRALLKAKANSNAVSKDKKSSLIMAVESRKPEIVKALIEAGADVKKVTPDGDSPVLAAAQDNMPESLEIIRILGKAGAPMDASNAAYTPLSYAILQENKELVKTLLEAGANPNAKTKMDQAPVHLALDNAEILDLLLKAKANPNLANSSGNTPLLEAAQRDKAAVVKALLEAGANADMTDSNGDTPLALAERYSQTEVAEILKKHGNKNTKTVQGNKVIAIEESARGTDCTIVVAAQKQMELHGLLQAQVEAGKLSSDIFRSFNEDTKDYADMLVNNPPEACKLFERLRKKYGV